jgi:hypothetical protein
MGLYSLRFHRALVFAPHAGDAMKMPSLQSVSDPGRNKGAMTSVTVSESHTATP